MDLDLHSDRTSQTNVRAQSHLKMVCGDSICLINCWCCGEATMPTNFHPEEGDHFTGPIDPSQFHSFYHQPQLLIHVSPIPLFRATQKIQATQTSLISLLFKGALAIVVGRMVWIGGDRLSSTLEIVTGIEGGLFLHHSRCHHMPLLRCLHESTIHIINLALPPASSWWNYLSKRLPLERDQWKEMGPG